MSYKRNASRYSKSEKYKSKQLHKSKKLLNKKKLEKLTIQYYRKYPDKFIEDYCGIKLYGYQKMFLRVMNKIHKRIIV